MFLYIVRGLLFLGGFLIFYGMIGYPLVLMLLDRLLKPEKIKKKSNYEPTVTYMVVAHNEEKVIKEKLENAITLDYPEDKFEILVASDHSTDQTNIIVQEFISIQKDKRIRLYCTKEHKGKTNAQNEAQKTVSSEILVMTDANSILKSDAIKELVASFAEEDIAYVCGRLEYMNGDRTATSNAESTYWKLDLRMRDIESRIKTITAGNGAIYACRNDSYFDFPEITCHDGAMPRYYAYQKKRALYNPNAVAYEKAGEVDSDEFKRKVRMNRDLVSMFRSTWKSLNIFKYGWFSFFWFGHRTCRYFLWLNHMVVFLMSAILAGRGDWFGILAIIIQIIWIFISLYLFNHKSQNRMVRMIGYYGMTIWAQYVGVYRSLTGQSKATWEKAESTR